MTILSVKVLVLVGLLLTAGLATAEVLTGKVVGVADGDTITVLDGDKRQHKVRLAGIDAPEHGQPFGQRSKGSLSDLVFGHEVEVHWAKRDRYQRLVGTVMVGAADCLPAACPKNIDAGLVQVSTGLAWWYRKYAREQSAADAVKYEAAEEGARSRRIGLWADRNPVPPWDWRKETR
jgi:endonuclease YncB( thermonuclease family)